MSLKAFSNLDSLMHFEGGANLKALFPNSSSNSGLYLPRTPLCLCTASKTNELETLPKLKKFLTNEMSLLCRKCRKLPLKP